MSDHRFVFVVGLHRSGTSLLHRCLREHPAVSGFAETGVIEDEGQFLQDVFPTAAGFGGPGRFGFHPGARLDEGSPLATPEHGRRLFEQWSRYWDTSKPVLVEKSPPTVIRTRYFQALFPRSRFVVLTRHPIATGYATQKWSRTRIGQLLRHWLVCHETLVADAAHLRHVHVLRYEDFVAEPQAHLDRIYAFLGLDSHPTSERVKSGVNDKYFARWEALRRRPWGAAYRRWQLRLEPRLRPFGYGLREPERLSPLVWGGR